MSGGVSATLSLVEARNAAPSQIHDVSSDKIGRVKEYLKTVIQGKNLKQSTRQIHWALSGHQQRPKAEGGHITGFIKDNLRHFADANGCYASLTCKNSWELNDKVPLDVIARGESADEAEREVLFEAMATLLARNPKDTRLRDAQWKVPQGPCLCRYSVSSLLSIGTPFLTGKMC